MKPPSGRMDVYIAGAPSGGLVEAPSEGIFEALSGGIVPLWPPLVGWRFT